MIRSWILLIFTVHNIYSQPYLQWAKVNNELGNYDNICSDSKSYLYQVRFCSFAKYSPDGALLWKKNILNSQNQDIGVYLKDITVNNNSIYVSGILPEIINNIEYVDFDPGPAKNILLATSDAIAFIAKYDTSGRLIWVKKMEASSENDFVSIGFMKSVKNNLLIAGTFRGKIDLDPTTIDFSLNSKFNSIYLLKLNESGNLEWTNVIEGEMNDERLLLSGITINNDENIFLIGRYKYPIVFSDDTILENDSEKNKTFLASYHSDGKFLSADNFKNNDDIEFINISADYQDNIYIAGNIFNSFADTLNQSSLQINNNLCFIEKYNKQFQLLWNITNNEKMNNCFIDSYGNSLIFSYSENLNKYYLNYYNDDGSAIFRKTTERLNIIKLENINKNDFFLTGIINNKVYTDIDFGPGDYVIGPYADENTSFFAKYSLKPLKIQFIGDRSIWKYQTGDLNAGDEWKNTEYEDEQWQWINSSVFSLNSNESRDFVLSLNNKLHLRKEISISQKNIFDYFNLFINTESDYTIYINGNMVSKSSYISQFKSEYSNYFNPSNVRTTNNTVNLYQQKLDTKLFNEGKNIVALELNRYQGNNNRTLNFELNGILKNGNHLKTEKTKVKKKLNLE